MECRGPQPDAVALRTALYVCCGVRTLVDEHGRGAGGQSGDGLEDESAAKQGGGCGGKVDSTGGDDDDDKSSAGGKVGMCNRL